VCSINSRSTSFKYFIAKVGTENTLKQTIWNESSLEISFSNGIRVLNFAMSEYQTISSTMFLHCNIHKFT